MPRQYDGRMTRRASRDLESIYKYIEQDSPQNAGDVLEYLLANIDALEILPRRHHIYRQPRGSVPAVHAMPVPPFIVYYRVMDADGVVRVLALRAATTRL